MYTPNINRSLKGTYFTKEHTLQKNILYKRTYFIKEYTWQKHIWHNNILDRIKYLTDYVRAWQNNILYRMTVLTKEQILQNNTLGMLDKRTYLKKYFLTKEYICSITYLKKT